MKFNTRTSCTKDEAVIMMLGLDKPTDLIGTDDQDTLYVKLDKTLEFMREKLVSDLTSEGQTQEYIAEFLDDFDKEFTKRARRYLIELDDELAKRSDSALRVLDDGQITLKSFYDWFQSITPKNDTARPSSSPQISQDPVENINDIKVLIQQSGSHSSLLVTFAYLLDEYIKYNVKDYLNSDGSVKITELAMHLETVALNFSKQNESDSTGQGHESIRKRISAAFKIRENYQNKKFK